MRKGWILGILLTLILATGASIAWVENQDGKITIGTEVALAQETSVNQAITDSGQSAIKQAIANVGPAVVRIDVTAVVSFTSPFDNFFNDPFQPVRQFLQ